MVSESLPLETTPEDHPSGHNTVEEAVVDERRLWIVVCRKGDMVSMIIERDPPE